MVFTVYLQVKNGRRNRCWCSLHGKLLMFRRNPDDQVVDLVICIESKDCNVVFQFSLSDIVAKFLVVISIMAL